MTRRTTRTVLALLLTTFALAACGSDADDGNAGATGSPAAAEPSEPAEPEQPAAFDPCALLTPDEAGANATSGRGPWAVPVGIRGVLNWRSTWPIDVCQYGDADPASGDDPRVVQVGVPAGGPEVAEVVELLPPEDETSDQAGPGGWPAQAREPIPGLGDEAYVSFHANYYRVAARQGEQLMFLQLYAPRDTPDSQQQVTELLGLALDRLPETVETERSVLPPECPLDEAQLGPFTGTVELARGGSVEGHVSCTWIGPEGEVELSAVPADPVLAENERSFRSDEALPGDFGPDVMALFNSELQTFVAYIGTEHRVALSLDSATEEERPAGGEPPTEAQSELLRAALAGLGHAG